MRRLALPGAVLLALAVVFVIAWATRPGASQVTVEGGQGAAVTSITRSCPPAAPGSGTPHISMIALPAPGRRPPVCRQPRRRQARCHAYRRRQVQRGPRRAFRRCAEARLGHRPARAHPGQGLSAGKASSSGKPSAREAKGTPPVTVSATGTVTMVAAPGGGGTAVAATGRMAEGFEAEQSDASGTGVVSCTHPGSDMWFVGTGQAAGASRSGSTS